MVIHSFVSGTSNIIKQHIPMGLSLDEGEEDESDKTQCNKDTGNKRRLQKWTRGTWFCISGGGHIQMWHPLYKYVYIHKCDIL